MGEHPGFTSIYNCAGRFLLKFPCGSGKTCAKIQGQYHPSARLFLSLIFLPMGFFFPEYSPWSHIPGGAPKDNTYPGRATTLSDTASQTRTPFTPQENVPHRLLYQKSPCHSKSILWQENTGSPSSALLLSSLSGTRITKSPTLISKYCFVNLFPHTQSNGSCYHQSVRPLALIDTSSSCGWDTTA